MFVCYFETETTINLVLTTVHFLLKIFLKGNCSYLFINLLVEVVTLVIQFFGYYNIFHMHHSFTQ